MDKRRFKEERENFKEEAHSTLQGFEKPVLS
jgi:hypothetical protein